MARTTIDEHLNMSEPLTRQLVMSNAALLEGPYHVVFEPVDPKRSNQANRYFHGVPVRYFRNYLAAQGQHFTHDQVFVYLRDRFLQHEPIFDPKTGEVIDYMPASSSRLSKSDFYEFVERVREWLLDTFDITTPDPNTWGVTDPAPRQPGKRAAAASSRVPRQASGGGLRATNRLAQEHSQC